MSHVSLFRKTRFAVTDDDDTFASLTRRVPSTLLVLLIEWYVPSQTRTASGPLLPAGCVCTDVQIAATCAEAGLTVEVAVRAKRRRRRRGRAFANTLPAAPLPPPPPPPPPPPL